ncbi:MAG: AtpZ/AtpI family protein [Eubacteriales bacterium]
MGYNNNVYKSLTLVTQFSINMLVPIFLCSFIGDFLDRKLGTSFWVILLFFVGAMAGFRNVYVFAKKIYDSKETRPSEMYGTNQVKKRRNIKSEHSKKN